MSITPCVFNKTAACSFYKHGKPGDYLEYYYLRVKVGRTKTGTHCRPGYYMRLNNKWFHMRSFYKYVELSAAKTSELTLWRNKLFSKTSVFTAILFLPQYLNLDCCRIIESLMWKFVAGYVGFSIEFTGGGKI